MPFLRFPSSRVLQRFHIWKLATKVGMYLPRLNYTEAKYPHITMKLWNIYEDGYNGKGFGCWKVLGCEWLVQLVIASCASSCWRPWSPYYRPLGGIFFLLLTSRARGSRKTQMKKHFWKKIKRWFYEIHFLGHRQAPNKNRINTPSEIGRYRTTKLTQVGRPGIFHAASALAVLRQCNFTDVGRMGRGPISYRHPKISPNPEAQNLPIFPNAEDDLFLNPQTLLGFFLCAAPWTKWSLQLLQIRGVRQLEFRMYQRTSQWFVDPMTVVNTPQAFTQKLCR